MQKVQMNGTLLQQMAMYQQIALQLASQYDPMLAEQIAGNIMSGAAAGQAAGMPMGGASPKINSEDGGAGGNVTKMNNARARAQGASQPNA